MIKLVLFDLDDTLISELDYIKSGYAHIAKLLEGRIGISSQHIYEKLMELFVVDSKLVFNRLLVFYGISATQKDILGLVEEYRDHYPTIQYYDGVVPTVQKLKKRGIFVGIITDGYVITQKRKLNSLGAYDLFDKIIITDEIGREYWKPHPRAFEIMHDYFHVPFNEMLYVGDNPEKDFLAPKFLGIHSICFNDGTGIYSKIKHNIPVITCATWSQLKEEISKCTKI